MKSPAEEGAGSCPLPDRLPTRGLKSALRPCNEEGGRRQSHSLLFINSRRVEMRPLCAVRLLVSPTRSSLRFYPTRTQAYARARARDDNAEYRE